MPICPEPPRDWLDLSLKALGILIAAFSPILAYWLGLLSTKRAHQAKVKDATQTLDIRPRNQIGQGVIVSVVNPSNYPLHQLHATLTIGHQLVHILEPEDFRAYIRAGTLAHLVEGRVTWASVSDGKNPVTMDLFAGEETALGLFRYDEKLTLLSTVLESVNTTSTAGNVIAGLKSRHSMIVVGSESGYNNAGETAAVALERRLYRIWIKLVSEDTTAKIWEFAYNPFSASPLSEKRLVSAEEFERIKDRILRDQYVEHP
jgi:hypothetical protein